MDVLAVDGLWKRYATTWAVQGLSYTVQDGEIVGLIGPNGAGKTTTLKAIVGLLQPDQGRIAVGGRTIADDPVAYKAAFGYMPESFSLPDYLSGHEFLEYVGRIHDLPLDVLRGRIREGLLRFDLWERRNDLLVTYSKGMRQKTAFLAATLHVPSLLLLDEPLIGIDPAGQARLKEFLRALTARGSGVLVSTHMLDTAERLCDRIVIVHHGVAVATGTMVELRASAHAKADSSLEEVFLQLTAEAQVVPPPDEPPRRRFGLWRR